MRHYSSGVIGSPKAHVLQGPMGPHPQLIDFDCLCNKDFKKVVEHFNSCGK